VAEYSNQSLSLMDSRPFAVPDLCNVTAISLLVLFGELLVLMLLFAGGEISWMRLALMSLFVQWVALTSAGLICATRSWLAGLGLIRGSATAFAMVMGVTLSVGLISGWLLSAAEPGTVIAWQTLAGQLIIAGIITALALRYFHVQQQLRASRIRPHFLFNSMNIIASLIATDPDTAETVVEDLSELFRASLNDVGNQVLLSEELDLCERYVRIESLRLGDRLKLDWQVGEPHKPVKIPMLTLQPLLENAIYHGRYHRGADLVRAGPGERGDRESHATRVPALSERGQSDGSEQHPRPASRAVRQPRRILGPAERAQARDGSELPDRHGGGRMRPGGWT
jgi:two-component system sensor histidine kinase AlgZ